MQIVIDIDENVFTRLFDNDIEDNEIAVNDVCEMAKAIRDGTPLPKGHGRLIDVNQIVYEKDCIWESDGCCTTVSTPDIGATPTIIEADKER